jgi:hypothetical protein
VRVAADDGRPSLYLAGSLTRPKRPDRGGPGPLDRGAGLRDRTLGALAPSFGHLFLKGQAAIWSSGLSASRSMSLVRSARVYFHSEGSLPALPVDLAQTQGIDDALIQPYGGHAIHQSLEIYNRLALSDGAS